MNNGNLKNSGVALVHLRGEVPVTDSQAIAREFGRRHDNVMQTLASLIADHTLNLLDFKEIAYTDGRGRSQPAIELTERGALVAMPFIGGRNSRKGQVRLVDAFLAQRRELSARNEPDRIAARRDAVNNYGVLSEILALTREAEGKETKPHHFSNEARLINYALTGEFRSVDRDSLSASDLRILNRLKVRDCALIGMGKTYEERKATLLAYRNEMSAQKLEVCHV